jgi:hypothetical protein
MAVALTIKKTTNNKTMNMAVKAGGMTGPTKAAYYSAKAAQLLELANGLDEAGRKEMLIVVAEYRRLAEHWAGLARLGTLARDTGS